ncbi:MAG TPA: DedA family protein [Longimicrobiaceae bacterium]|nr:DedA family protein [Longimicrobiaceae bacterium]
MISPAEGLLQRMLAAPDELIYLVMAVAAALENLVPPVPADVVILFGGFLLGKAGGRVWLAALLVWLSNVAGALVVYGLGRRFGMRFFAGRWGRMLLRPGQLAALAGFYQRYGFTVIFISRFLPVFRSVVPIFAGVSHVGLWRTALPILLASGLWYGGLIYLGAAAGENWESIWRTVEAAGRGFYLAALLLTLAVLWWWRRSRQAEPEH